MLCLPQMRGNHNIPDGCGLRGYFGIKTIQAVLRRSEAVRAEAVDSGSPIPLYYQIASLLRSRILSGVYPAGGLLSTENELAESFGVSRITSRQALGMLASAGLIERHRGRGTFVADDLPESGPPVELHGFLDDIILQADYAGTVFVDRREVKASADVARALEVPAGTGVVRFRRLRATQRRPHAWVVNHLRADIAARFDTAELRRRSLLRMIDETPGLRLSSGYQTISARAAAGEPARRLGLEPGSPVLHVERVTYAGDGTPLELVRAHYPGEHHRFGVHLSRAGR